MPRKGSAPKSFCEQTADRFMASDYRRFSLMFHYRVPLIVQIAIRCHYYAHVVPHAIVMMMVRVAITHPSFVPQTLLAAAAE